MKRFSYTLTTTKPGGVCVLVPVLELFRHQVQGDRDIGNSISSDVRLDDEAIRQFETRHSVSILFTDRLVIRGEYLLAVARDYPKESLSDLKHIFGETLL